jgi:phosphoesterase RecJ-like protein
MSIHREIREAIGNYATIIVTSHAHPDGDAIGSVFGAAALIRATYPGKTVLCVGEEKESLADIAPMDTVADEQFEDALVVVIDTANTERISDGRWRTAEYVIKIDHHPPQEDFGDLAWVDTGFSSCAEMVADLITEWGVLPDRAGAELTLYGMVTDTGRFRFSSVSARTLRYAAHLIEIGADLQMIYSRLYSERLREARFKGYILSNFGVKDDLVGYMYFPASLLQKHRVGKSAAVRNVNLLAGIDGISVWAFFVEYDDFIRVELRSSGPEVNKIASAYGGGGHVLAAGAKIDSWETAARMVEDLRDLAASRAASSRERPPA